MTRIQGWRQAERGSAPRDIGAILNGNLTETLRGLTIDPKKGPAGRPSMDFGAAIAAAGAAMEAEARSGTLRVSMLASDEATPMMAVPGTIRMPK